VPRSDGDVLRDLLVSANAAFVDGGHSFHDVFVDLFFLRKVIRSNGIEADTRLRAYRLPTPEVEPSFEQFEPFGLDSTP
jgi:hypothetical protein